MKQMLGIKVIIIIYKPTNYWLGWLVVAHCLCSLLTGQSSSIHVSQAQICHVHSSECLNSDTEYTHKFISTHLPISSLAASASDKNLSSKGTETNSGALLILQAKKKWEFVILINNYDKFGKNQWWNVSKEIWHSLVIHFGPSAKFPRVTISWTTATLINISRFTCLRSS